MIRGGALKGEDEVEVGRGRVEMVGGRLSPSGTLSPLAGSARHRWDAAREDWRAKLKVVKR